MPKTIQVKIDVTIPDDSEIDIDDVPTLISRVIDSGLSDAFDSANDEDLYTEEAEMICSLEIGQPTL